MRLCTCSKKRTGRSACATKTWPTRFFSPPVSPVKSGSVFVDPHAVRSSDVQCAHFVAIIGTADKQ